MKFFFQLINSILFRNRIWNENFDLDTKLQTSILIESWKQSLGLGNEASILEAKLQFWKWIFVAKKRMPLISLGVFDTEY